MTHCAACWNSVNWLEAFNKFGHGDGEDCVHTGQIARAMEAVGYEAEVLSGCHNDYVVALYDQDKHLCWPRDATHVGYDNPYEELPQPLVQHLDSCFGKPEWYN